MRPDQDAVPFTGLMSTLKTHFSQFDRRKETRHLQNGKCPQTTESAALIPWQAAQALVRTLVPGAARLPRWMDACSFRFQVLLFAEKVWPGL